MLHTRKWSLLAGAVALACLAQSLGQPAAAVDRTRNVRTPPSRTKPASGSNDMGLPAEATLGDDHQQNIEALQRERLEVLRHRLDVLTRAFSMGRATERQVDQATLEQLQAELEVQDRPHLRVQALTKVVEIRQKFEDEAKQRLSAPAKPGDINAMVAAHGRYISARLARIHSQVSLEREQLGQRSDEGKSDSPAEKPE